MVGVFKLLRSRHLDRPLLEVASSDSRRWRRRGLAVLAQLCILTTLTFGAAAFRVSPLVIELEVGGRSSETLLVENTLAQPLTAEVTVFERTYGERGEEYRRRADEDLSVFPRQFVVQPGETQSVRIQYVGDPALKYARNYVVLVSQLPVDLSVLDEAGVQFIVEFGASVTVSPPDAAADVEVEIVGVLSAADVELRLQNVGDGAARLGDMTWVFSANNGDRFALRGAAVQSQISPGLLLPGATRTVRLSLPPGKPAANLRAVSVSAL